MRGVVSREEVLHLSAGLFASNGYTATNLKMVADELQVTRQALYYYFHSKAAILAELFEQAMEKLESGVAQATAAVSEEPRFHRMLRAHVETIVANKALIAVMIHERPQLMKIPGLDAVRRRRAYHVLFSDAYDEGVRAGSLRPVADVVLAVDALLGAVSSISWWHAPDAPGLDIVGDVALRLFTGGYLVSDAAESSNGHSTEHLAVR